MAMGIVGWGDAALQVKGGRREVPETAPQQVFEMLQVFALGRVF
jgi:hypothetical protein